MDWICVGYTFWKEFPGEEEETATYMTSLARLGGLRMVSPGRYGRLVEFTSPGRLVRNHGVFVIFSDGIQMGFPY